MVLNINTGLNSDTMNTTQLIQEIQEAIDALQQQILDDPMREISPDCWRGSVMSILDVKHKISEITNKYQADQ